MRIARWLFTVFFSLLLCTSCSIEKRMYRGGYYIQWHKRKSHVVARTEKTERPEVADTVLAEETADTLAPQPAIVVQETVADTTITDRQVKHRATRDRTPKKDRKFEPVGEWSAGTLVPAFLVAMLKDQSDNRQQSIVLGIVFLLILSLSMVLGIISMVIYLRDPDKYRFNIWAILGIVIPLFFFIALLSDGVDLF